MNNGKKPAAVEADKVPPRNRPTLYPGPFASMVKGREKRQLGDFFGLSNFGVNLTRLAPGSRSALRHSHSRQDEFIYVLEGRPTLYTNEGATRRDLPPAAVPVYRPAPATPTTWSTNRMRR